MIKRMLKFMMALYNFYSHTEFIFTSFIYCYFYFIIIFIVFSTAHVGVPQSLLHELDLYMAYISNYSTSDPYIENNSTSSG